jgi:outer membrane protein, heavy metal efflux system
MRDLLELRNTAAALALLATSLACATVDARPDFARARVDIRAVTGVQDVFDAETPPLTDAEIEAVLRDGLTLDEALRLALLNNRRLHAGFMRLGVRRAEYVQAGLLSNPRLSLAFLFPSGGGRTKFGGDLAQNVADVWQLPAREDAALAELEHGLVDVSRLAGELVADTRSAYFESVAALAAQRVADRDAELARRSLEGVRARVASGVAPETDASLAQSVALGAELAARHSEHDVPETRRRLAALLSLEVDLAAVPLTDPLPAITPLAQDAAALVEFGKLHRLDLRAANSAVSAAEARVALERGRVLREVSAGVAVERPEHGSSVDLLAGLTGSVELPLFDQNQAQIARAEFRCAELEKEREALVAEATQAILAACERHAHAVRTATFVADELVPGAERAVASAQRAYELGYVTVLALLDAQRAALLARQSELEAQLECVRSGIELERSVGAPLGAPR